MQYQQRWRASADATATARAPPHASPSPPSPSGYVRAATSSGARGQPAPLRLNYDFAVSGTTSGETCGNSGGGGGGGGGGGWQNLLPITGAGSARQPRRPHQQKQRAPQPLPHSAPPAAAAAATLQSSTLTEKDMRALRGLGNGTHRARRPSAPRPRRSPVAAAAPFSSDAVLELQEEVARARLERDAARAGEALATLACSELRRLLLVVAPPADTASGGVAEDAGSPHTGAATATASSPSPSSALASSTAGGKRRSKKTAASRKRASAGVAAAQGEAREGGAHYYVRDSELLQRLLAAEQRVSQLERERRASGGVPLLVAATDYTPSNFTVITE